MREPSAAAQQELQNLLSEIMAIETVSGAAIVGHDGALLAANMPNEDAEALSYWALSIFTSTEVGIEKLQHGRVHQIVARTSKGYLVIANYGGGLLFVLTDSEDLAKMITVARCITRQIAR
jgi:predicted regulator of Ras-like GTPase activity (Roadblock/LC7/MglB family)